MSPILFKYQRKNIHSSILKNGLAHHLKITLISVFLIVTFCLTVGVQAGTQDAETRSDNKRDYNIIMIWIDALRADHLGCYGYHRDTSPNIDKLANESILFEKNFTPHTVTIASFMSIITSLYPLSHGVQYVSKDKLSPQIKTMAQILKAYDYQTAWFGPIGDPHLDPDIGYGRGYDEFNNFPIHLPTAKNLITQWITDHQANRFFLNVHTYQVHDPYMPSQDFKKVFTSVVKDEIMESREELDRATVESFKEAFNYQTGIAWNILGEDLVSGLNSQITLTGDVRLDKKNIIRILRSKNQLHMWSPVVSRVYAADIKCDLPGVKDHLIDLYDATILEFDTTVIGPIVDNLKKLNLYDNTIIIICADHGDEFCEHGRIGHGLDLYEETTHVPLIIRLPLVTGGKRVRQLVQTIDILPTILSFLEIPIPYYAQGISLMPYINSDSSPALRQYVFGQLPFLSSIRSDGWKFYKHISGTRQLFHLESDPSEQIDLLSNPTDTLDLIGKFFKLNSEKETIVEQKARRLELDLEQMQKSLPSYKVDTEFKPQIDKAAQERIKRTGYW